MRVSASRGPRTSFATALFAPEYDQQHTQEYFGKNQLPRQSLFDDMPNYNQTTMKQPQQRMNFIGTRDVAAPIQLARPHDTTVEEDDTSVILRDVKMNQVADILYAVHPYGKVVGLEDVGEFGVKVQFASPESTKNLLLMRKIIIGGVPCDTLDVTTYETLRRLSRQNESVSVTIQSDTIFQTLLDYLYKLWN